MPEALEVNYFLKPLKKFEGKKLLNLEWMNHTSKKKQPLLNDFISELPMKLKNTKRKGKILGASFEKDYSLIFTFGMSGSLEYKQGEPSKEELKYTKALFRFENDEFLLYNNVRNFGTIFIIKGYFEEDKKFSKFDI